MWKNDVLSQKFFYHIWPIPCTCKKNVPRAHCVLTPYQKGLAASHLYVLQRKYICCNVSVPNWNILVTREKNDRGTLWTRALRIFSCVVRFDLLKTKSWWTACVTEISKPFDACFLITIKISASSFIYKSSWMSCQSTWQFELKFDHVWDLKRGWGGCCHLFIQFRRRLRALAEKCVSSFYS